MSHNCNFSFSQILQLIVWTCQTENLVLEKQGTSFASCTHTHPFSGTTRVSRCQTRTSGLYSAREDKPTIQVGLTPSGLISAHLYHPPIFYRPDALPATQPTVSKHWRHPVVEAVAMQHLTSTWCISIDIPNDYAGHPSFGQKLQTKISELFFMAHSVYLNLS